MNKSLTVIVCLTLIAAACVGIAQEASIRRSSNLRKSPGTGSEISYSLKGGDTVTLISSQKRAGYYHVRTNNGTVGWVWAKNVTVGAVTTTTARVTTNPGRASATFSQSCSAPLYPGDAGPMDSTSCGVAGSGGNEATQNTSKNNFCATGPARSVSIQDLVGLQQQVESDKSIPFGNPDSHPLTNNAGPAIDRSSLEALGEGSQVVLTGYIKLARQEGAESVNCGKNVPNQPAYHDIHISIVDSPNDAECSGVVAEMIPHDRPASWTPTLVNQVAKRGLPVRLTGNLMFDSSHTPCQNATAVSGDPSRSSLWEVHPIYKFEVCTQSDCSLGGGWTPLESWQQ
jgi:Bacterial SH3 domain